MSGTMRELVLQDGRPAARPADQHEKFLGAARHSPSLGRRGATQAGQLFRKLALCGEDKAVARRDGSGGRHQGQGKRKRSEPLGSAVSRDRKRRHFRHVSEVN